MRGKRGAIGLILFFAILFTVIIVGFIASIVIGVLDFGSDTITPIATDLGVAGFANFSEYGEYTFGNLDTVIQALPMIMGFAYVIMLLFSVVFAVSYTYNPNPAFLGLYFMLVVLLIFGTIIMSNMYENIYNQNNELSDRLQEQTILSYMILHSPMVMVLIAFITGIYLFTRNANSPGGL